VSGILLEPVISDDERRKRLYEGITVTYVPRPATEAFVRFAWELICEAFHPRDPKTAQLEIPVEQFVEIISPLKTKFTHHQRSKELIREVLREQGCDLTATYFDVPKLRIVTHSGYLTAGVGYAYKSHRDIWYACPPAQINWWTPISNIDERSAFVIHPNYFQRKVKNNSVDFDAYRWNAEGRKNAATYIKDDPRPHPHLQEELDLDWQVILGRPGSMILFSAQHLHATVPNTSPHTRFSIDFRTVHRDDIEKRLGANIVDSSATGTTLRDFLCANGFERLPESVVAPYDTSGDRNGVLVFDPSALQHQMK
jgi:hypothetical protein